MRNFMNQRNQKLVFIQTGIDRNFVFSTQSFSIIAVTCYAVHSQFSDALDWQQSAQKLALRRVPGYILIRFRSFIKIHRLRSGRQKIS